MSPLAVAGIVVGGSLVVTALILGMVVLTLALWGGLIGCIVSVSVVVVAMFLTIWLVERS